MGFFDKKGGNRGPVGQRPPHSNGPKTPERPLLLPPLEDRPKPRIGGSEVSAFEPTVASDQISLQPYTENPTRNINGARPPPLKAKPAPLPETIADEPSEIQSAVMSYESKLQELDAIKAPDELLLDQVRQLHNQAMQLFESKKKEPNQSDEDLQKLNGVIEKLSEKMVQLVAKVQFQFNKAQADNQPLPPPLPVEPAAPISPTFGKSISIDIESPSPKQMAPQGHMEPQLQEQPSAFKRFITSPVTWAVINFSAFTAFLFSKKAFQVFAEGIGRIFNTKPPSEKLTMIVYGAVSVGALAITGLVNYLRNRKAEKREQDLRQNGGPTEYP